MLTAAHTFQCMLSHPPFCFAAADTGKVAAAVVGSVLGGLLLVFLAFILFSWFRFRRLAREDPYYASITFKEVRAFEGVAASGVHAGLVLVSFHAPPTVTGSRQANRTALPFKGTDVTPFWKLSRSHNEVTVWQQHKSLHTLYQDIAACPICQNHQWSVFVSARQQVTVIPPR